MRYIFFGSYEFACIVLERLIASQNKPLAVVCNPDRPIGRKKNLTSPPVKNIAQENAIPIFQPERLEEIKDQLKEMDPQIAVIAAYAKIVSKSVLEIPRLGTFGIHPSLLPRYRGATPIQTAILNGDHETGATLFKVDEKVDHGPILSSKKIEIEERDTYRSLENKLALYGAELFERLLKNPDDLKNLTSQNETEATYTQKFKTSDGFVLHEDIEKAQRENANLALEISRKVRALGHEPGIWTLRNEKRVKLLEVTLSLSGFLSIKKIQKEGKKPQYV